jgi:hypothetical protein
MELKTEQNLATFEAMEGNFEGASRNLRNALVNARQKLIDRVSRPLPYTLKALSGSVYVEEESRQALNQIPERYKETRDMVSYLVLDQLTNLSLSAYRDLDHPYYVDYARRSSDWELDSSRSIAYFDGIRRLAVRFLSFQDKIKDALATDGVELRTARASAVVAIRLLEHSPFRRGFCPSIRDLESLVRLIDRFDGPDQRIPRDQQRRLVRSWIASILDRLNQLSHQSSCDSYRPFPSNP